MTPTRLAIAWTVAVLVACSVPAEQLAQPSFLPFSFDKWVHVGMFVVFGLLWTRARPDHRGLILVSGVAFGIGIEVWQGLLPIDRTPDPLDAAADVVGLLIGVLLGDKLPGREASNG